MQLGRVSVVCVLGVFLVSVNALEQGDRCQGRNNVPGTCRLIYECRQALTDLKAGLGKALCKTGGANDVVCCPDPGAAIPSGMRLSERKCLEYSEMDYENKRKDRCSIKAFPEIVGGKAAAAKEFPHMARLGYQGPKGVEWGCGGTIISKRYILTAGHCGQGRSGQPTMVRIGDINFEREDDDSDPQTFRVSRVIAHPQYRSPKQYNDIALVEVESEMRFNEYSRPACLNSETSIDQPSAIATGWGNTGLFGDSSKILLKVTLDLFKFDECSSKYEKNRFLENGLVENQQLCAGSYNEEKDTCEGDSGGPLQVFHSSYCMHKVLGVTSFGTGCGTVGLPAVYARVSNYIDWIEGIAFNFG